MALKNPHLAWPFAFDPATGHLADVEQDTAADVLGCVELLASVTPGELVDDPEVGVPDVAFVKDQRGAAAIVEHALRGQEERAPIAVTLEGAGAEADVVVTVDAGMLA